MTQLVYTDFKGIILIKMIEGDEDYIMLVKTPHRKTDIAFVSEKNANYFIKEFKLSMYNDVVPYRE